MPADAKRATARRVAGIRQLGLYSAREGLAGSSVPIQSQPSPRALVLPSRVVEGILRI